MEKHFINLTNGIEWISELKDKDYSFIRIQSTTIECKNWIKLIGDLDHNFLMSLALGYKCKLYDCGTNRPFSKTIYSGVELIKYILNRYWYDREITDEIYRRDRKGFIKNDILNFYKGVYCYLFEINSTKEKVAVKTKLGYYKRFLNSDRIHLEGISKSTTQDGNYTYYSTLIKNEII